MSSQENSERAAQENKIKGTVKLQRLKEFNNAEEIGNQWNTVKFRIRLIYI